MNAINVIAPFKHLGTWIFSDARAGIEREPFVSGADTLIDSMVADIPNAEKGFFMIFSAAPFPGHQKRLEWRGGDSSGHWYYLADIDTEGWLCPALFTYFDETPKDIYVQLKAR